MTISACLRVPETVTIRSSRGVVERDFAVHYGFVELARQLQELGWLTVHIIRNGEDAARCDVEMVSDLAYVAANDTAAPTLLLDAAPNCYLQVARAGLLGAVTADGLDAWRSGRESIPNDTLVGRRDIAQSMGAVGGSIMGPSTYCFVTRSDLTTLPTLLNAFLMTAIA